MKKLLLVDDSAVLRMTMVALLEDEGYSVDEATSVAEGRERINEYEGEYAAILLDRLLEDGFGTELIPLLRERRPTAKIILFSGMASPAPTGADVEIGKAEDLGRLLAYLRDLR